MRRADFILRLFNSFESSGGHKCENGRAKAGHTLCWDQHGPAENVRIHAIQDFIFLRNTTGIDDTLNANTVCCHAIEDDAGVQRRTFDGCKKLVLCSALEVPSQSDSAQVRVHQHGAITVVPGEAQQSGLACAIIFQSFAQFRDIGPSPRGNRIKYVANRGKSCFDASTLWMNASLHHAANPGHQIWRWRDSNDASGSAYDVHHVIGATTGANGVPMCVEGSDRNRNSRLQSQLFRPERRERSCDLFGSCIFTLQLFSNST